MRIGLDSYTIGHLELSAGETLEFARSHGLQGVQFLNPLEIDPGLDPGRLADFRRRADGMGLYLEVGLPTPNPVRASRLEGRPIAPAEHAGALAAQCRAIAALGCSHARAYVGDRHDRFRSDVRWAEQVSAATEVLRRLAPTLRELGLRVALETHADLTVAELLRMVDALGTDVAGVTLDTGNLAMRLDDPAASAARLAPLVLSTHIKDIAMARTPRGLAWQVRPIGSGILPMPDMLAPLARANPGLNLSIELHPRIYDLPTLDPSWLAFFPELDPGSKAAVEALADSCERRFADGSMARPEAVEAEPWPERCLDWVARSLGYLRAVVRVLDRPAPPRD